MSKRKKIHQIRQQQNEDDRKVSVNLKKDTIYSEEQREDSEQNNNFGDMWDHIKRSNIRVIGVPRRREIATGKYVKK